MMFSIGLEGAKVTDQLENYAYLFEAKGIQRYILDSGTLRDLIGASDLVAGLASSSGNDLLKAVIDALDSEDQEVIGISRRAGGCFMAHSKSREALERLRALWRLAAGLRCPGLEMADVLTTEACGSDILALKSAYENGSAVRFNAAAELPPTGHPFTAFNARTGRLTTRVVNFKNEAVELDVLTDAHRVRADQLKTATDGMALKFLPGGTGQHTPYRFPRNLDPDEDDDDNPTFPFRRRGKRRDAQLDLRIALVHADVSGLAQAFRNITENASCADDVRKAADEIEAAILAAVQTASEESIVKAADGDHILPARPIVLGGDDVTVIVRGDIALPFTRILLEEIEKKSLALAKENSIPGFAAGISACAGVAFVGAGHPFLMANAMAESLCKFAKKYAKKDGPQTETPQAPYPSLIAFHNVQSTVAEDYEAVLEREFVALDGVLLTANPYRVGDVPSDAYEYAKLEALADALAGLTGTGDLLKTGKLSFESKDSAQRSWARWRDVNSRHRGEILERADLNLDHQTAWSDVAGRVADALECLDLGLVGAPASVAEAEPIA